jgi:hypothetical protein|nr:MAG TPA: hypothetical protein [Caudoviricetes sp.]
MKLFEFFNGADALMVAAKERDHAIAYMAELDGITQPEVTDNYDVREVPREEWAQIKVHDPEQIDTDGNYVVIGIVEDMMQGITTTELICSTNDD